MPVLTLLPNLGMGGGAAATPTPTPTPTTRPSDAGAGRRRKERGEPWWTGEWITPGVDAYLPERPPEDITPLRPKVERVRERVKAARPAEPDREYQRLTGQVGAIIRQVNALEALAARAVAEANERTIERAVEAYRAAAARLAAIDTAVRELEARAAHRQRIIQDDEDFLTILMTELKSWR